MYYIMILVLLPKLDNLTTYLTTDSYDYVFIFKHVSTCRKDCESFNDLATTIKKWSFPCFT